MHCLIALLTMSIQLQGACLVLQQLIERCKVNKEFIPELTSKVTTLLTSPMTFDEVGRGFNIRKSILNNLTFFLADRHVYCPNRTTN